MIEHVLAPLDGSPLAECVLPHVISMASAAGARVTLLHVLERHESGWLKAIDPLDWHLRKGEARRYLENLAGPLQAQGLKVEQVILEGPAAESIITFASEHRADLVVLSSHGRSGLSEWNVSSVVQKVMMGSFSSTLLVRAFRFAEGERAEARYNRLFVGLDCSPRAEFVLPLAASLAGHYRAQLTLGTVVRRPEMLNRFPLSPEDSALLEKVAGMNHQAAHAYLEQLHSRLSVQGLDVATRLVVSDNVTGALHDMVEQEKADLVILAAHGHTAEGRRPFGSVATSFIAYGNTSLVVMQDLSGGPKRTRTRVAARGSKER